jgi:hypothetical protein
MAGFTAGSLGGPSAGGYDVFLSKFDASGNLQWVRQLGTSSDEAANTIGSVGASAYSSGNVYLASCTFGDLGGPNAGREDAFLAKYDDDGNLRWIEQFGTSDFEGASKITVDGFRKLVRFWVHRMSLVRPRYVRF